MEKALQVSRLFHPIQSNELEAFRINDLPEIDMNDLGNREPVNLCGRWVNNSARFQYIFHLFYQEIYGNTDNLSTLDRVCCFLMGLNEELYRIYEDIYDDEDIEIDKDLQFFLEKELEVRNILYELEAKEDSLVTLQEITNLLCQILEDLLQGFSVDSSGNGMDVKGWVRALYRAIVDLRDGKIIDCTFQL